MASRFKSKSRLLHSVAIWIFIFHKKIRLCEGDLRPISNQLTGHNEGLFYLKIQIYYINFPSIFSRNCQIDCFLQCYFKKFYPFESFFVSNHNSNISTHLNSSDSVQKAVNLTIPGKNRRKMNIIDLNFQIKKSLIMAGLKLTFKITFT